MDITGLRGVVLALTVVGLVAFPVVLSPGSDVRRPRAVDHSIPLFALLGSVLAAVWVALTALVLSGPPPENLSFGELFIAFLMPAIPAVVTMVGTVLLLALRGRSGKMRILIVGIAIAATYGALAAAYMVLTFERCGDIPVAVVSGLGIPDVLRWIGVAGCLLVLIGLIPSWSVIRTDSKRARKKTLTASILLAVGAVLVLLGFVRG